jgi:hypothetical protein
MPEPNRARYRIEAQLQGLRLWQIIEAGVEIVVMCDAYPHFRLWKPHELKRTFAKLRNTRIEDAASHMKCRECGSNWLRIAVSS